MPLVLVFWTEQSPIMSNGHIATGNFDYKCKGTGFLKELVRQSLNTGNDYQTATLMYKRINEVAPICLINELAVTADLHS